MSDFETFASWQANARNWTAAVREGRIGSRKVTDKALLAAAEAALAGRTAPRVLDLGCGEGWLVRTIKLRVPGALVSGLDGSAGLVRSARGADPDGSYRVVSYEEAVADPARLGGPFDLAVLNFALFQEDLAPLLSALHAALEPGGDLLVQTLHPLAAGGPHGYRDGWRKEGFEGFGDEQWAPMPWYFRTLESWIAAFQAAGFALTRLAEPRADPAEPPLSLLLHWRAA
jgi:SAM-dependent methyltransferase